MAINKLRLPRKLLEKWVEEPFFDTAVVGCFVRLGVGKAPGLHGEPQYKVCEIIGVGEYKHSYALGEFQTKKALLLRIGRNTRLWRMNVISNHRFTPDELNEWQSTMFAARQKIPSAEEISKRKARMRETVFGASSHPAQNITDTNIFSKASERYSEGDVARLVNSRRKRSEAARFRERQTTTVSRLNHGQIRTRYEHEVCAARQAYLALLIAQSTKVRTTPEIQTAVKKVDDHDACVKLDDNSFERNLDTLASSLMRAQQTQLHASAVEEALAECRATRNLLSQACEKLKDFRKNALDVRKLRDTEVPSRTSTLYFVNEAKRRENSLADMTHGERKLQDEQHDDDDAERAVFQRRATKPTMLWTTDTGFCQRTHKLTQPMCNRAKLNTDSNTQGAGDSGAAIEETETANCALDESISPRPRKRTGMSLQEYMTKAHADASRFTL